MDKKELTENLGKIAADDRNQDPAIKATEKEVEEKKKEAENHEPGMLEKLGKTQAGAVYEDPAMKETERETEEEKEKN